MRTKPNDLTDQTFFNLTAVIYLGKEMWLFRCNCGNLISKKASDVKRGRTKSCSRKCTTKNPSKHPLYQTWDGVKKRCYSPQATGYKNYGGRGIVMCDSWKESFWNFVKDMGEKPSPEYTLDRINNNGHYCKENCVWSSPKKQSENRRNNLYVNYKGVQFTLFSFCKLFNLKYQTVYWKIKRLGMTPDDFFKMAFKDLNLEK